jgi:hypothetical protein
LKAQAFDSGGSAKAMHLLFLDEFGHENPTAEGQCPVFGYGGFMMPAERFSEFSTEFFDSKIATFKAVYKSRIKQQSQSAPRRGKTYKGKSEETIARLLHKLDTYSGEQLFSDPEIRRVVAQYEIKGSDAFSSSYIPKMQRKLDEGEIEGKARISRYVRIPKRFLGLLNDYDGQIFFVGMHRSRVPKLRDGEKIHVTLIKDVIDRAYKFAQENNTTIKIIFDHHYTDVGSSVGPSGTVRGFVDKTRSERARELIISCGYYDLLTEPVFNAKSHLSQGVQAADWICTLLKYLWVYKTEKKPEYETIHNELDRLAFSNVADVARFRDELRDYDGSLYERQMSFGLFGGRGSRPRPGRPYRPT